MFCDSLAARVAKKPTKVRKKPVIEPPLPVTRAEKRLDKRERIKAAAWELFTTVGFEATRTKDVAEKAGIATGTLFLYASDKVDLLSLVMHDRLLAASDEAFLTMPKGVTLVEQLLHVFRAVLAMYAEEPAIGMAFVKHLQASSGPNGQQVAAMTFAFLHRLGALIMDAAGRGEVAADTPPLLAAQSAFALYFFALQTWLSGFTSLEAAIDPHLSSALELMMKGLAPR